MFTQTEQPLEPTEVIAMFDANTGMAVVIANQIQQTYGALLERLMETTWPELRKNPPSNGHWLVFSPDPFAAERQRLSLARCNDLQEGFAYVVTMELDKTFAHAHTVQMHGRLVVERRFNNGHDLLAEEVALPLTLPPIILPTERAPTHRLN